MRKRRLPPLRLGVVLGGALLIWVVTGYCLGPRRGAVLNLPLCWAWGRLVAPLERKEH